MDVTIEKALNELRAGNNRFVSGETTHPHTDKETLRTSIGGQHPFAFILSCSDSRVPVDLIFDRGVGDLFVVKVAGNVFGDDEIGSAEYAVEYLETPLLVVMGHNDCGMVKAVYEHGVLQGFLNAISKKIFPAVEAARTSEAAGNELGKPLFNAVDRAARINVWNAVEDALRISPVIRSRVKAGLCQLVGAFYWINTGEIDWMGQHPKQGEILGTQQFF